MSNIMPATSGDTNPTARERLVAKVTFHSDRYEADFMAELDAYRAEILAEAIEAARSEYLTDATGTDEDNAYNNGITDAVAAIGALLERGAR